MTNIAIYAILSPAAKTDNITLTVDSAAEVAVVAVNYSGTKTTSISGTVKYLVEA